MIGQVNVLQEKINNLAIYNGKATIEQELEAFNFALSSYKQTKEELMRLQVEAGKLEHELALLMSRIAISQTNHDYNVRRKAYLDKLEALHDLFNVTKFPRKLIETYMSNVQASLSTYLQYFGMPFTIKVEEGFKIRLYNENGLRFPTVSGGQEIMIGICLRLALHQMFAQAFPIWIIDEGSNNLSEVNRQNYFNLINELRQQKIIQQIIVVDHDERLTAVVDQVIQL
jgi:DNA repair exonuclease SbcCD ATPase subunit